MIKKHCRIDHDVLYPCTNLKNTIEKDKRQNKGILSKIDFDDLGYSGKDLFIRSGVHRVYGIGINYCPFCGFQLRL